MLFDGDTEPETVDAMVLRLGQPKPAELPHGAPAMTRAAAVTNRLQRPKLADMVLLIGRLPLAEGMDLIRCCIDWHPARRITAVECMRLAFLHGSGPAAAADVSHDGAREQPDAAIAALPVGVAIVLSATAPLMEPAAALAQATAGEASLASAPATLS